MKYDSKYLCDTLGIDPGGVESIEEAQTDSGPVYHITLAPRPARCPAFGGTRCKSKGHTVRRLSALVKKIDKRKVRPAPLI